MADKQQNPIIYAASDKAKAERIAPREVLAKCKELQCDNCGTAVLAVERTLADMVCLSQRTGRRLLVVCQKCFEKEMEDHNEDAMFLNLRDAEINSQMKKHIAGKN